MTTLQQKFSKYFGGKPFGRYPCPSCREGQLVPDKSSFFEIEPAHSKIARRAEDWDPDWIDRRFSYQCVCNNEKCSEVAFVSGVGGIDQAYGYEGEVEFFDFHKIKSFFPAPAIIPLPDATPGLVSEQLKRSFSLYWTDTSAAANAMRASLEALLDELKVPRNQKKGKDKIVPISLHRRIELWAETHKEYAELCIALKEVGNLGSHGETVRDQHYFGALEIYSHVLKQLFENDAASMKVLAAKIQAEIKGETSS